MIAVYGWLCFALIIYLVLGYVLIENSFVLSTSLGVGVGSISGVCVAWFQNRNTLRAVQKTDKNTLSAQLVGGFSLALFGLLLLGGGLFLLKKSSFALHPFSVLMSYLAILFLGFAYQARTILKSLKEESA